MALTKLPKNAIGTGAVKANNIADGTIQNTDISGCASVSADKLSSTLDLSTKSVTFANNEISNAELANSSFTLNGSSISLGGSTSIITYLDWQAVQVADGSTQVNAEVNKGYFLDTNAGVIEVFLPTSPTRGDVVGLVDYSGTFGTNQLIINTGGVNIDSTIGSEFKVTTNNAIVECVYVDSAKGWLIYLNQAAGTTPSSAINADGGYDTFLPLIQATGGTLTTSGDYRIHTFTGDGCFVVSSIKPSSSSSVDYLVVAGGAGGGGSDRGGGGGAGGFRESHSVPVSGCYTASPLATPTSLSITATTYPITVGAGGGNNSNGSNSVFSTITSAGGGRGASPCGAGSGGSGGGGSVPAPIASSGSGNTPPTSPPQGSNGGGGNPGGGGFSGGGGGGGATAVGGGAGACSGGNGGNGGTTSISGTPTAYAGGGGGHSYNENTGSPIAGGSGGTGGGGTGGPWDGSASVTPTKAGTPGTANTGGGGGGAGSYGGGSGNGGKGIVIIRYKFQ